MEGVDIGLYKVPHVGAVRVMEGEDGGRCGMVYNYTESNNREFRDFLKNAGRNIMEYIKPKKVPKNDLSDNALRQSDLGNIEKNISDIIRNAPQLNSEERQ